MAGRSADLALLDVNLAGQRVYPVADALSSRHVPFIFLTGCSEGELPDRFSGTPMLVKPFSPDTLLRAISHALPRKGFVKRHVCSGLGGHWLTGNRRSPPVAPQVVATHRPTSHQRDLKAVEHPRDSSSLLISAP